MEIIEFNREQEDVFPYLSMIEDPVFHILVLENGVVKDKVINLKGRFSLHGMWDSEGCEEEAYKNYVILKEFLEDNEEVMSARLGLSKNEYGKFLVELYVVLIKNHSSYGWFKKRVLIILEYLKYYCGRFGI